jgi:hypothetical protein
MVNNEPIRVIATGRQTREFSHAAQIAAKVETSRRLA